MTRGRMGRRRGGGWRRVSEYRLVLQVWDDENILTNALCLFFFFVLAK